MKKIILILLLFVTITSNAQDNQLWFAFWDSDTTYIGFKDINGEIKIEPNLVGFTTAKKFDKIMAVIEDDDGNYKNYYLTKSGKKVGVDSLFIYDNASDCESEGFIRFMDKKTEMVGMFNQNGEIAIPAKYNALSRVENGLLIGVKGAKKDFWDEHKESGCNHFSWKGGKQCLMDTKGQILAENFDYSRYLNFYSLKIETEPINDSIRQEFKGVNGKYYSFIDFEKEFNTKFKSLLSSNFTKDNLLNMSFDSIYYWKDRQGWISEPKTDFMNRNFEIVKDRLLQLVSPNTEYTIFVQGLNPYIYESESFAKYFNNCGEARESKYPVMNIVINNKIGGELVQDHFDFLKTDKGYELISMTIRTKKIE
tara:strand:+ start:4357 stop:5454 length:1098 start_codon:yes stop_codon:yes gene_type:complete